MEVQSARVPELLQERELGLGVDLLDELEEDVEEVELLRTRAREAVVIELRATSERTISNISQPKQTEPHTPTHTHSLLIYSLSSLSLALTLTVSVPTCFAI
jgi:hypothetical protein